MGAIRCLCSAAAAALSFAQSVSGSSGGAAEAPGLSTVGVQRPQWSVSMEARGKPAGQGDSRAEGEEEKPL